MHMIVKLFGALTVADFIHYAAMAGTVWLFFYVVRRRHWLHRKVVPGFAPWSDVRREIALSALTCVISSVVALFTIFAAQRGWTRIYLDIHVFGWWWFAASVVLTILLHDAYFYWTHRLMHLRSLFPIMHRAHHRSTNPTPWAAYAFDPLEAFVQAGILPLVAFLYPIHPLAFILFMGVQVGFNVFGHAGFEIFPHRFLDSRLGKFFNTPTNHAMHHQHFGSNYGLYFNLWDRLMGTNHKNYEARFREVTLPSTHSSSIHDEPGNA
jgi:lathosterol oxidase